MTKSASLLMFLKLTGQSWRGVERLYPTYLKQSEIFFFTVLFNLRKFSGNAHCDNRFLASLILPWVGITFETVGIILNTVILRKTANRTVGGFSLSPFPENQTAGARKLCELRDTEFPSTSRELGEH